MTTAAHKGPLIVVAPTFYQTIDDPRYELGLEICREASRREIRLILVDASPLDSIRIELKKSGICGSGKEYVRVCTQTFEGKKGAALREAIFIAQLELDGQEGFIAFQEPEKIGMVGFWDDVVSAMIEQEADICVPRRSDQSFKETYPIEQYHSERFANLYLDSLGKRVGFPSIDWTMGPVIFRSRVVQYWLKFHGQLWDAQIVPMINAFSLANSKIVSYEVDYRQPLTMKAEEEGIPKWSEKRLMQLNFLFDKVGSKLKECL